MPSEIMQQQGLYPSSFFSEDICFANEVGFRMSEAILDRRACKKSIASYPLESFATQDDKRNLSLVVRAVGAERKAKQSFPLAQHENSLFGSSLSDLISREMKLSPRSVQYGHSVETTLSSSEEEEQPLGSLEEIEAQTIGNLLPDDDDLFSGVNDVFDHSLHPKNTEDAEEMDLFSNVGGIELGDDVFSTIRGSEQVFKHRISSSVSGPLTTNMNAEMFQSTRFCMPNQNGQAFHLGEGGFASVSNGNHLHPGFSDTWSNAYSSTISPVMWPNSPSVRNGNPISHSKAQLHGLPRAPSAPTLSNPLWERRRSYTAPSLESLSINPGSLGGLRVPCRSHYMDLSPCSTVPHGCGNCMELTNALRSVGLQSPQTPPTMYNGRGLQSPQTSPPMYNGRGLPSPQASSTMYNGRGLQPPQTSPRMYNGRGQSQSSTDSPHERSRSRRNEGSLSQADKKQFELDVDRIASGEDRRTTLMIKNIPNKYTSKMLLAAIDEHHKGTYDFIYLPIDFKNKCNVGYAFINMTDPSHIIPIYETFNGKKWEKFNSEKVASIAYARIQGNAALVAHFQNSSLMNEDKRCRPILFNTEGPNAGDQVPFPMGVNVRSRPSRTVRATHE